MNRINDGIRKARNRHYCWHCNGHIEPGEMGYWQTNVDDCDDIYTIYMHPECERACCECEEYGHGECTGGECRRGLVGPECAPRAAMAEAESGSGA